MTDAQRRYMKASQRLKESLIFPVTELLEATAAMCADEKERADRAQTTMEVLRPVWAQGFTSDSQAAQATGNALAELWQMLGVTDQTAAVSALRPLTGSAAQSPARSAP